MAVSVGIDWTRPDQRKGIVHKAAQRPRGISGPFQAQAQLRVGIDVVTETVVAYVVRTDGEWTVLLIDRGRNLRYVPTTDISSREPCSTDIYSSTLIELITGPQLPQCYP
jgi:hypothetical protein